MEAAFIIISLKVLQAQAAMLVLTNFLGPIKGVQF